jgi:hypothetical protein
MALDLNSLRGAARKAQGDFWASSPLFAGVMVGEAAAMPSGGSAWAPEALEQQRVAPASNAKHRLAPGSDSAGSPATRRLGDGFWSSSHAGLMGFSVLVLLTYFVSDWCQAWRHHEGLSRYIACYYNYLIVEPLSWVPLVWQYLSGIDWMRHEAANSFARFLLGFLGVVFHFFALMLAHHGIRALSNRLIPGRMGWVFLYAGPGALCLAALVGSRALQWVGWA